MSINEIKFEHIKFEHIKFEHINEIKFEHIKFEHINKLNSNNIVDPILELYKGKLYTTLLKLFINDCINQFNIKIFSIKKSYSRTLTNILSSWIFSLYISYDFSNDYFFPSNYNDVTFLENVLKDLSKYDDKIQNIDSKIKIIIDNLKKNYSFQLKLLKEYSDSIVYKNNIKKYKIEKEIINISKTNNNILFYKFNITSSFAIKDAKLQNILNNILLPIKIYDKLVNVYTGPKNKIDEYLWAIIFRYQLLGSNNHQLAVLPQIFAKLNTDYNLNFECFASAINNTFNNFCSIYYDLEQYFGSKGSFFNMKPVKGTFGFNPPYQKDIMELGISKLLTFLDESSMTKNDLTFIITIPIWDIEGKKAMKELYNNELEKQNIDYGEFEIINNVKNSKYFKGLRMISKEEFTYVDHNFDLYKNKTIQNTYVILLSNSNVSIDKINEYNFFL
jgi:hypothetical protein